jgi:hypothetical protein
MVMSWKGFSSGSKLKVVRMGTCSVLLLSLLGSVYWLLLGHWLLPAALTPPSSIPGPWGWW